MNFSLKLKTKRKPYRASTQGSQSNQRSPNISQSLNQVLNVSFTDYCSIRTKKKLDQIITHTPRKTGIFFHTKQQYQPHRYRNPNRKPWLVVHPVRVELQRQNHYLKQKKMDLTGNNNNKTIHSGSRFTKDWISKKLMELEMAQAECQWVQANGKKIDVPELHLSITRSSPFRNRKTANTETVRKIRSQNTSLQREYKQKRHRTIYSRSEFPQKQGSSPKQKEIVLSGWQNDDHQF